MASKAKNGAARSCAPGSLLHRVVNVVVEAALKAFVVMLLGDIALKLLGSLTARMIPSMPPGLSAPANSSATWTAWWTVLQPIRFHLIFALLLLLNLWSRLAQEAPAEPTERATRWQRIRRRFADNWFGSLVGNALLALAIAPALAAIPEFTFWRWLWQWLTSVIHPDQIVGEEGMSRLSLWLGWYDSNQTQLTFWLVYLGAVCDDLGIPNFKSLARWLWQRQRRRRAPSAGRGPKAPNQALGRVPASRLGGYSGDAGAKPFNAAAPAATDPASPGS